MDTLTTWWHRLSDWRQDLILAVSLALFTWGQALAAPLFFGAPPGGGPVSPVLPRFPAGPPHLSPVGFFLIAAACLTLALRRRYPLVVLGVVSAASAAYERLHQPPALTVLAVMIAIYTVGTLVSRRTLFVAVIAAAAVGVIGESPEFGARWAADVVRNLAVIGVAGALGDATRNRRAYVAEVEERAAQAERTREEETRRRIDEERLRIARELHDVTAHSLSIIAVQSGAAERIAEKDPPAARAALRSIRETSKSALEELRAMVGVMRGAVDEDVPLDPTPRLSQLDAVVSSVRAAGVDVSATIDVPDELPGLVESSAFRVVQEALTNVVRHAKATSAHVTVAETSDALVIEVIDDGAVDTASVPSSGGHGIAGMRERVAALNGHFSAGPRAGGGFRVFASIPLPRRNT